MRFVKLNLQADQKACGHAIAISRRALLQRAAIIAGGATVLTQIITATNAKAAVTKISQRAAHYQSNPKGEKNCGDCANFDAPLSCKLVEGRIGDEGWCKLFVPKH
jgi:hypothetical protein